MAATEYTFLRYDTETGEILSSGATSDASVTSTTGYWVYVTLPSGFRMANYYMAEVSGQIYLIQAATGYAYNRLANRVESADQEPQTQTGVIVIEGETQEIEGDRAYNGVVLSGNAKANGSESGAETSSGESGDDTEATDDESTSALSVMGGGTLAHIDLTAADWVLDQNIEFAGQTGWYIYSVAHPNLTMSTVLHVTGVNLDALQSDIYWVSSEGKITFLTDLKPTADIGIDGLLRETGDEWSATGRINAYPGKQYRFARYYHSLHVEENANPITVPAGTSISVVTPVSFAAATLMFAVPEWTGNDHITVPKIYVNNSLKKLCFTLMNHGSEDAIVTEVELRLMYSGTITGLITESDEEESENSISASNGENVYNQSYITNPDIDGLDE